MSGFWAILLGVVLIGFGLTGVTAIAAYVQRRRRRRALLKEQAEANAKLSKSAVLRVMRQTFGPTARFRNVQRDGVEVVQLVVGPKVIAESDQKGGWKRLG